MRVGLLLLVVLLAAGCGGARPDVSQHELSVSPIYGSTLSGVRVDAEQDRLSLRFESLPAAGCFLHIILPAERAIVRQSWIDDSETLHLIGPTAHGAELGVVPLEGFAGQTVSVELLLGPPSKSVLAPPQGPRNEIGDLTVTDVGGGAVELRWTERNIGDYDFNGEVNAADLVPLVLHFLQTAQPQAKWTPLQTQYWVDGDGNGEINAADIVAIAAGFRSRVSAYRVLRNGSEVAVLPVGVGQRRNEPKLPRLFTFSAQGALTDSWQVEPIDDGLAGTGSGETNPIDASLKVQFNGLDLKALSSGAAPSGGFHAMRVVLPGDLVGRGKGASVAKALPGPDGSTLFSGVPRGEPLCLDVVYVPAVNLATGQPRSGAVDANGDYPEDWYVATRIPFTLPFGTAPLHVDAEIEAVARPGGGYDLHLRTTQRLGDDNWTTHAKLDFPASRVAYDSDNDGSFSDEPQLTDTQRTMVSDAYVELLQTRAELLAGGTSESALITGTLAAAPDATGTLQLDSAVEKRPGGADVPLGSIAVRFTEIAQIHALQPGVGIVDIDPFALNVGDPLSLQVEALQPPGSSQPALWAGVVERRDGDLPADMLYAVPEVELAYPGQAVRITVLANATASPFHTLRKVRLLYPDGCALKPGSFNVGAPGGERWDIDGAWTQVAPAGFEEEMYVTETLLSGGMRALDVSVRPLGGSDAVDLTGALFNLELTVEEDCTLSFTNGEPHTFYADGGGAPHEWSIASNLGLPGIKVVGERPVLSMLNPPAQGSGKLANPYIVAAGADYDFALSLDGMDVTASPDTQFGVEPAGAGSFSGNRLTVASDYSGALTVRGRWQGILNTEASTVYLKTAQSYTIGLDDDPQATFRYGGAASFGLQVIDHGGLVEARVVAANVSALRGAFFRLSFDPTQLTFDHFSVTGDLEGVSNGELVEPTLGMLLPYSVGPNLAWIDAGLVLRNPQARDGLTAATAVIASVYFTPGAAVYPPRDFAPPTGGQNMVTNLRWNGSALQWEYYNAGDYDQNGIVGVSDLNLLAAKHGQNTGEFGGPFPDQSLEHAIDTAALIGLIDDADRVGIEANPWRRLGSYLVLGSDNPGATPDPDDPLTQTVLTVPFGAAQGDPESTRLFFVQSLESTPELQYYWIVPQFNGQLGVPSNRLSRP